MQEHRKRSIVKTLTYRITSSFITMIITYVITGALTFALSIGLADVFIKVIWYYLHERIWDKVKYGKELDEPDYSI
ncbi:MAG: hypothetical protein RIS47_357 [Bacteroidota bacterium]